MKSLISIIILSLILTNCGFKPIYSSKNTNFQILEIKNKVENKNSFMIENMVMGLSNKDALKNHKSLEILHLNQNPLGEAGIRAMLRLAVFESSPITRQTLRHKYLIQKTFPFKFQFKLKNTLLYSDIQI